MTILLFYYAFLVTFLVDAQLWKMKMQTFATHFTFADLQLSQSLNKIFFKLLLVWEFCLRPHNKSVFFSI